MISDLELINRIKEKADNEATMELINRHSGIYFDTISQYSFSPKIQVPELRDDRTYNIFSWALKYEPAREVKFSSYVGKMTRYMCLNLINRGAESVELEDTPNTDTDTQDSTRMDVEEIRQEAAKIDDKIFWRIFKLRFDPKRPRSWREVGSHLRMSHEGARKHFMKHIGLVKEHMGVNL